MRIYDLQLLLVPWHIVSHATCGPVRTQFLPMTPGMRLLPMYNPEIGELGKLSLFCTRSTHVHIVLILHPQLD